MKDKKVLILGQDLPDGGVASANWLLDQGARVTIMSPAIKRIQDHIKKTATDGREYEEYKARLTWVSGKISNTLKKEADMVIADPSDELALFCRAWPGKIIAVTGTHGKTTAATWAVHLIRDAVLASHTPDKSPMAAMVSRAKIAVIECASPIRNNPPQVVQTDGRDRDDTGNPMPDDFSRRWGQHNVTNLRAAVHVARCAGVSIADIAKRLATLPQIPYRQQVIYQDRKITVVNDAAATTPERALAALHRWSAPNCILVAGGEGRDHDFALWAQAVSEHIRPTNVIFLAGSATDSMRKALGTAGRGIRTYDSLERCWRVARARAGKFVSAVIVFSPGARSGKFSAHQFERGQQFAALARGLLR